MIEKIKHIINLQVIISAVILAVFLSCLLLAIQAVIVPNVQFPENIKADVNVTPLEIESRKDQKISADIEEKDFQSDGVITNGSIVRVSGTGQDGLRMRVAAGTDQKILFLAKEGEFLKVVEGPKIKDQLIWWKIQALEDSQKIGWSVQDYLIETQP